ncbi:hypothetical protein GCM10009663_74130 [Kitasatospora arboriphila]|uniref:Uncharacterized protein n=1 Tax=Kitasatospora arboriphila TaxID=258052 RepID=A0ABN1U7J7_9ACTN
MLWALAVRETDGGSVVAEVIVEVGEGHYTTLAVDAWESGFVSSAAAEAPVTTGVVEVREGRFERLVAVAAGESWRRCEARRSGAVGGGLAVPDRVRAGLGHRPEASPDRGCGQGPPMGSKRGRRPPMGRRIQRSASVAADRGPCSPVDWSPGR